MCMKIRAPTAPPNKTKRMTMKLPSIQTDLQAVPEQPEIGEMITRAQEERDETEILTETGEEREEAEEEERDDD